MVYNVLTNSIINSVKYKIYDDYPTSKFYNYYFTKVLIINFMSMQEQLMKMILLNGVILHLIYLDFLIIYQIIVLKLQQYI